jgi:hypothetical protein
MIDGRRIQGLRPRLTSNGWRWDAIRKVRSTQKLPKISHTLSICPRDGNDQRPKSTGSHYHPRSIEDKTHLPPQNDLKVLRLCLRLCLSHSDCHFELSLADQAEYGEEWLNWIELD